MSELARRYLIRKSIELLMFGQRWPRVSPGPSSLEHRRGGHAVGASPVEPELMHAARHLPRWRASRVDLHGAFPIAATGHLAGRRATTHWEHVRLLARRLAQRPVVHLQRSRGQSQFSAALPTPTPRTSPVRLVLSAIAEDPTASHTLTSLARVTGVSPGTCPASWRPGSPDSARRNPCGESSRPGSACHPPCTGTASEPPADQRDETSVRPRRCGRGSRSRAPWPRPRRHPGASGSREA